MLLTALILVATLLPRIDSGVAAIRGDVAWAGAKLSALGAGPAALPRFTPEARAVSNWREEAGGALRPKSLALVARYAAAEPTFVARCVKLNNYWCIKSARWSGEIGSDSEGHTAFATAADGADAAAQLLRRYYRALGRRTALAIVRRWAPAECRLGGAPTGPVAATLAPRGIGRTLRARFLARHGRGGARKRILAARGGALRVQPWSPLARMGGRAMPTPKAVAAAQTPPSPAAIAKGPVKVTGKPSPKLSPKPPAKAEARLGAAGAAMAPGLLIRPSVILAKPSVLLPRPSELLVRPTPALGRPATPTARPQDRLQDDRLQQRFVAESAALPAIAAGLPGLTLLDLSLPAPLCGADEARIRNYAAKIAGGVGLKIEDDLRLFGDDDRPLPNLAPVMLAMSGVELGALRAGPALVETAIARLIGPATASAGPSR